MGNRTLNFLALVSGRPSCYSTYSSTKITTRIPLVGFAVIWMQKDITYNTTIIHHDIIYTWLDTFYIL